MRLCVLRIALASLWLFSTSFLSAQVGFSLPFVNNAASQTNINLPVTVTNFDSIVSVQFVIRWDPSVLKYLAIDQLNTTMDIVNGDFNTSQAIDSGIIRFAWEGPNSFPGISLADNSTIFRVRVKVIGANSSSTSVLFTEIQTFPTLDFEVVQVSADTSLHGLDEDDCLLDHGFVAVGFTVAAGEPSGQKEWPVQIFPNPFSETSRVQFDLDETTDVQAVVTDMAGRMLFEKTVSQMPPGRHGIEIEKAFLPEKGAYFLTLRAGNKSCAQILFLL